LGLSLIVVQLARANVATVATAAALTSEVHLLTLPLSIACSMVACGLLLGESGRAVIDADAAAGVTPSQAREF
jgi:hypothetical protein